MAFREKGKSRRRGGWLEETIVSVMALAWICRGAWRLARGRDPWSPAR